MTKMTELHALAPGEHLVDQMIDRQLTYTDVVTGTGIAEHVLRSIVRGDGIVGEHQATMLGYYFEQTAEFWLNIQKSHDAYLQRDTGEVSDGYHTFNELYEHRQLLFVNLCLMQAHNCAWKRDLETKDWFILYLKTSQGQISYHIEDKYLILIESVIENNDTYEWDYHTSKEVVHRLTKHAYSCLLHMAVTGDE